jgi:hypothetical protein
MVAKGWRDRRPGRPRTKIPKHCGVYEDLSVPHCHSARMMYTNLALTPASVSASVKSRLRGVGGVGDCRATEAGRHNVLPASVAAAEGRPERFQREGEVLVASLTHSNIPSIYGQERSGATTALVME